MSAPVDDARRPSRRQLFILCAAYFALAVGAVAIRDEPANVAFFWPANAVAVAYLARWPVAAFSRLLAAIALANLLANLVASASLSLNVGATSGNLLEIGLGAWLIQRWAGTSVRGVTLASSTKALGIVCLIAAPLGGCLGAAAISASTGAPWRDVFWTWITGDVSGYSLLLVPSLAVRPADVRVFRQPRAAVEVVVQAVVLTLVLALGWQVVRFPFVLMAVPATWVAVRNGLVRGSLIGLLTGALLIATLRMHLWTMPAQLAADGPGVLWFPIVAFMLFSVQVGLIADDYRSKTRRLEASERRVASALEAAAGGFVLADFVGRVRLVNGRVSELLRQPRAAILGNLWRDLLPTEQADEILETTRRLIEAGTGSFDIEQAWPQPDGSPAWIHIRGSLLPDGKGGGEVVLQLDDVSARRVAEDRVRVAFEELTAIIDHIPAMIGYWDADNRNRFANPAYADWFGSTPDLMRGRPLPELLGERRWENVKPLVAALRTLTVQTFEGTSTDRKGAKHHQFATYLPNAVDGVFRGFAVIVSDITPVKVAQETLAAAKEQAEQASRQKSAFVANMSHEIRTPLNAILGAAWLLERRGLAPDQLQYLELIQTAGQSLLGLLNDVLDFSKIEAGRLEIVQEEFELQTLLGTASSVMVATAGNKALELVVRVEPDVPRLLMGDALRLQQVLVNLTGNAVKFTASGEVELSVERSQMSAGGPALRFAARDTGIGMTPSQQEQIFAPFAQADASINRRFGGTGLGLAITRRLVEAMHGEIVVQSALGQGTTFAVLLPLLAGAEVMPVPNDTPRVIPFVLVVDDSPAAGRAICRIVETWGWMVEQVNSADEAWASIRRRQAHHQTCELLIVDRQMPGTDGVAFLAALRADPWTLAWPAVLAEHAAQRSGHGADPSVATADGVVVKPVMAAALADVVQGAFATRAGTIVDKSPRKESVQARILQDVRIMLVEDNPLNQIVARGVLEQAGAQVEVHASGASAIARLRTVATFDAILMDIQMPEMDGFTAAQIIREELTLKLPIIALTAGVMPDERARCLDAGMNEFVPKPLDVPQLLAVLAAVTGRVPPSEPRRAQIPTGVHRPEAPIFAPDGLLQALGDDPQSRQGFLDLVSGFVAQGVTPLEDARAAWQAHEPALAAAQLHSLRGAVGTLGAQRFAATCRKLEQSLKQHPARVEARHFDAQRDALAQAVAAARVWLAEQPLTPVAVAAPAALQPVWLGWLRAQDFRACSAWPGLRPELAARLPAAELDAIDSAMHALDFATVLAVLARCGEDLPAA